MATIRECLAHAGGEANLAFLDACDEGLHAEACAWVRAVVEPTLEQQLDYTHLRMRAQREIGEVQGIEVKRPCWYCDETNQASATTCAHCGRPLIARKRG